MNNNKSRTPGPNQYRDRNGNIRTRAIRWTLKEVREQEKAKANR